MVHEAEPDATRDYRRRILRQRLIGDIAQVAAVRGEAATESTEIDRAAVAVLEIVRRALVLEDLSKLVAMTEAAAAEYPVPSPLGKKRSREAPSRRPTPACRPPALEVQSWKVWDARRVANDHQPTVVQLAERRPHRIDRNPKE